MEIAGNLKSLDNKTGQKIVRTLKNIISDHDKYQKCYFWSQTGNASSRRRQEFTTEISFFFDGVKFEVNQSLSISCKNFYYSCDIRKDGKKSNIKAIKGLI